MDAGTLTDFNRASQELIEKGLEKLPTYQGTVYRGMIIKRDVFEGAFGGNKGDVFKHNRFVSSSKDVNIALEFAKHSPLKKGEIQVVFEIISKNGRDISRIAEKNGIFVPKNQQEVLFINNTTFEILDSGLSPNGMVLIKMIEK